MRKTITVGVILLLVGITGVFAQEEALSSVGALGTAYIYTTYLSIGAIADSHANEVYDEDTTIQLLEEIRKFINAAGATLQQLRDSDVLSSEDFDFVNEILNALGLLYREAESYQSFVKSGDEQQAALYEAYRQNAWKKISELLGIEE